MYSELHCKTNYSFLLGASHPDELVVRASELGYQALAITDRNSLAGVVRAHVAAKEIGVKLLIGAEITPLDAPPVVLLATDRAAYGRLSRLITCGRRNAPKGECRLTLDDIAAHAEGLLAAVFEAAPELLPAEPEPGKTKRAVEEAQLYQAPRRLLDRAGLTQYRDIFGDRCYLLAELHRGSDDAQQLHAREQLARQTRVPLVAAGDVHYHTPARKPLHDVLTAVRNGCTVTAAAPLLLANAERHLKSLETLHEQFAAARDAVSRTCEVADRCTFSLDELRYEYPEELAPAGKTPAEYLNQRTWQGARKRYPNGIPPKVQELIEYELQLIADLHYEAYFLTVADLVHFARRRRILCQGRGSAANSAVCYCLGVTSVDPERMDVLFERFISRERNEAPDIDVDFEHERREEVLQYIYEKYGRERAGMTAEVITYRPRSAMRDVGKALGLSLDRIDALAKTLDSYKVEPRLAERCEAGGLDVDSMLGRQLLGLVGELIGFPRHLSQHVGGMVITQGSLCEIVPIENAAMADRTVIQWNKDDLDALGILKVDCLALGMLTAIRKCFTLVEQHHGRPLTLASVPEGDNDVYDMICRADTMGVFQIESRAQMSMLPRLRPRCFYDLVIEVAIVRPGPIQGNMVHPYLRRRAGEEAITYPNDEIRDVLKKTLGVPLFQEQAMRLAVVAAGFTPGEADQLRRAMSAWRRSGIIETFGKKLTEGMRARGLSDEFAEHVFRQIRGFGEYGFPESHAASFALLVYVSCWLKHHYPDAFCTALINSQPMGFYAPAQLIRNAQEHRVSVRSVDVNASRWDCTLEDPTLDPIDTLFSPKAKPITANGEVRVTHSPAPRLAIRLGMRMIRGLSEAHAERIVEARQAGPFHSVQDLARRTRLSQAVLSKLAAADAFRSMALDRRGSLWQALLEEKHTTQQPLFEGLDDAEETPIALPSMTPEQEVFADYRTAGLSLKGHPISFVREQMNQLDAVPAADLSIVPNGRFVRVGGLVLVRQRPSTAKGITFVTLEDETGTANLIVKIDVWERFHQAAISSPALLAHGRLQRQENVIHVLVSKLESLSQRLNQLGSRSRDFH